MTANRRLCVLRAALLILLALATLVSSLALVPTRIYQGADSAAYAYVAQVMLDGGLPYRDARDNKPPLTFLLNAVALALLGVDFWALWWLRAVTVAVTGVLFAGLLRDLRLSRVLAWLGAFCMALLLARPVWADTNAPELYALPFQILCLRAGFRALDSRRAAGRRAAYAFLAGTMGGMALLGKQTSGGVLVAFVAALLVARAAGWRRMHWRAIPLVVLGSLLPLLAAALWLAAYGALDDAFDAAIRYNWHYAVEPVTPGRIVTSALTENDAFAPIVLPLAAFAVLGALSIWKQPGGATTATATDRTFRLWIALTMALDMLLVNLAATGFGHYFLTPLPAFLALVMLGIAGLLHAPGRRALHVAGWISVAYVALLVVLLPNVLYVALVLAASGGDLHTQAIARALPDYVTRHTAPGDTVLVWGYDPAVNLLSGRRSPSAYFYAHPLTLPGYSGPARIAAFVDDLRAAQPALIIDETLRDEIKVPPLDPARLDLFYRNGGRRDLPDITPVRDFVAEHCTVERRILMWGGPVTVYRCVYE